MRLEYALYRLICKNFNKIIYIPPNFPLSVFEGFFHRYIELIILTEQMIQIEKERNG